MLLCVRHIETAPADAMVRRVNAPAWLVVVDCCSRV
jgi:hypothetical protein